MMSAGIASDNLIVKRLTKKAKIKGTINRDNEIIPSHLPYLFLLDIAQKALRKRVNRRTKEKINAPISFGFLIKSIGVTQLKRTTNRINSTCVITIVGGTFGFGIYMRILTCLEI